MTSVEQYAEDLVWVCSTCVQEAFLQGLMTQRSVGECSCCGLNDCLGMSLEELADRVETAFESHYQQTSAEPDSFQQAMLRDKESNYNWERVGEPVLDVLAELLECGEDVATEVQTILDERHGSYDPRDGYDGESPFSCESCYEQKAVSTSAWELSWQRLENSLQHESRLFNQEVLELFHSVFSGLDNASSQSQGLAIVTAGPGRDITALYRAREFQSDATLKDALQRPVEALGPPPGRNARSNRLNSSGISVFYGACEAKSALAEVRPVVGSNVVVAKFSILRPVQLLDLPALEKLTCNGSLFDPQYAAELERHGFLRSLSKRLVMPVMPNDQDHAYLITQAVADYLASLQSPTVDGIIFPSVQDGVGLNVVLFHKASLVAPLDFPPGTTFSAELWDYDHDTGKSHPSFWLQVDKPSESVEPVPAEFQLPGAAVRDAYDTKKRQPALKLELEEIKVHTIKAVEVKDVSQKVFLGFGTYPGKKTLHDSKF